MAKRPSIERAKVLVRHVTWQADRAAFLDMLRFFGLQPGTPRWTEALSIRDEWRKWAEQQEARGKMKNARKPEGETHG